MNSIIPSTKLEKMSDFQNNYSYDVKGYDSGSISNELQELIDNELENGEIIEWITQPIPRYFTNDSLRQSFVAIPFLVIALFFTFLSAQDGLFAIYIGIPFILIGVGLLLSPVWTRRKLLRTVYAITNRRVITLERKGFSFDITSYEPDELTEIHRKQKKDGTGDIFVFQNIRNVKEVERKLRELRNNRQQNDIEQ
ncbi:MAG: hypothetical protein LBC74_03450 [Planctomycetaceae bacterium]|jgi:hypothetical protein|nr:hypothetical protein [Planctomycetaceae bacterium]